MNEIILKIPKRKNRIRVAKTAEDIEKYINKKRKSELDELLQSEIEKQKQLQIQEEENKLEFKQGEEQLEIIKKEKERIKAEIKKPPKCEVFIEKFSISGAGKPIEISLDKVSEDTLTLDEVMLEVQESYDRGFNDGKEAAKVAYDSEIAKYSEWIKKIDLLAEELEYKFSKELNNFSEALVKTTLLAARKIIDKEISNDGNIIISQIRNALRNLDDGDDVLKITIHPDDYEILAKVKSSLVQEDSKLKKTKIIADKKIERGGCILHTIAGEIDSQISSQLDRIGEMLTNSIEESKG
jgi:flagellar biosynthesis/type III secretory pathway protein FliH